MKRIKKHAFWILVVFAAFALCSCDTEALKALDENSDVNPWALGPIIAVATFSSEDLTCATTGVLAYRGVIPLWIGVFWCWLGIFVGDNGLYWLGRWLGPKAAKLWLFRSVLTPKRIRRGERMFAKHGGWVLFTSRFLPGTRVAFFVAAGIVKYPFNKFAILLGIAAGLWAPAVAWFAFHLGEKVESFLVAYEKLAVVSLGVAVVGTWILIQLIIPLFTHRGRMMWVCRLRRMCEWRFWPSAIVFSPVFFYILWLGIKHRKPLAFTACNPVFDNENNSDLLNALGDNERVAKWKGLKISDGAEKNVGVIEAFIESNNLQLPVVLKPDIGEHGRQVSVVRSLEQARECLDNCASDMVVQEYLPGEELTVFYAQRPGAEQSEILSTARRELPKVEGDGKRTLERLILANPHALRMAGFFLDEHEDQIDEIPPEGTTICLTEVGARQRGGILTDAEKTGFNPESIRLALDELVGNVHGFHFGQFGLKLAADGSSFKLIDFGGIGAETGHIYQRGFPLWRAWRDVAMHWRVAFEIGMANIANGAKPLTLRGWIRRRRQRRGLGFSAAHPAAAG